MKRIELFGPPGVGKTSLLRILPSHLLIPVASARQIPLLAHQATHGQRRLTAWMYGRKNIERWMRHRFEKEMVRAELKHLRTAAAPWPEFIDFTMHAFADGGDAPALLLERLQSFTRQVATAHVADRLVSKMPALFDEGLLQRGISLAGGSDDTTLTSYLHLMPLPALAVRLEAYPESIHARLRARNPGVDRFHAMVERANQASCQAVHILEQRGASVLTIDSEQPIPVQAAELADQLQQDRD